MTKLTDERIDEGLRLHRLPHDKPSQSADCFRNGARWAASLIEAEVSHGAVAEPVALRDAPAVLNENDKAFWVIGWNAAVARMLRWPLAAAIDLAKSLAADERLAFEAWYSDHGASPRAVERSGDGYALMQAQSAWAAWQAAWAARNAR